ncbi:uncharacterized protein BXZ73DRAFT_107166 [Epithele typhae]|uniref:uncharacterized protein n=1 Tax=Epithele typhae TaxID=378194 RepID=UPI00200835B2|nr:uncharacterized protein BXZ73DRAFT_107166 [Epithele typhae]KAH9912931.1 hypothetical protein BXZ73DRAFT_107166 [Epithele typhae]
MAPRSTPYTQLTPGAVIPDDTKSRSSNVHVVFNLGYAHAPHTHSASNAAITARLDSLSYAPNPHQQVYSSGCNFPASLPTGHRAPPAIVFVAKGKQHRGNSYTIATSCQDPVECIVIG